MNEARRTRLLTMLRLTPAEGTMSLPDRLCRVCTEVIGVDGAGLSLMTDQLHRETIGASNDVAARIEELQLTLGEGPCIDAFTTGRPVLAPDLDARAMVARWPGFTPGAVAAGVRAVFGFPLGAGAVLVGALDLFRQAPGNLGDDQITDALVLADLATIGVLGSQTTSRPYGGSLDWRTDDVGGRHASVHQATGMLMIQLDVSIEEAFVRLHAYAFASDRRLPDVAADVVARRLRIE